ncbi:phosphoribosylaminoimidazole-succinocarboxamide synthase [Thermostichus sp. MS-CIW-21]|jgi:phosphoribosylaminoimidazole-succinocarboxamide synthase|uniref:phosphoribosylaminoimidazolesuccinocarboxamide synthase n=1 Tax=unclassified Synechococcus TaxID=2626047 RepID=UPI000C193E65|nr:MULTISPECIES: phosphoribosylaminoimidazolesuccinocarboxamide synthase [unclassified Synechococcus]PIK86045.1 phosphoribosylaminoimidazole-succinocarboxamide synthase [Synechococcus sp. 63AY4M2]PIK95112.1 phosphoribosylaminoimidazole-succinocarboxamide synthase [Synechococcus sp. 60AY4M2]PIK97356.1 phosphoribosylaminoimidazole-succinocarboxamide synthase [Synechococcus sp. 63AY4M1]PIL01924.1 phosphoribosylaminoimidazole-succinocarboxamide synthase [Synechococcus sp. 65AY640]
MPSSPTPQELLYEGKAKRVYRTADPQVYLCQYKDDATAFNAQKRGSIPGKGEVNCTVSSRVFAYLAQQGIRNHFLSQTGPREMQVRALQILPLEVVVRNRTAGSLCQRLGLEQGLPIEPPLVEFYYKNDALGDPLVTPDHIRLLHLATPEQVEKLGSLALAVNTHLGNFWRRCRLELVDFKLEFGLDEEGQIWLADEISPDTCRLWDLQGTEPRVLDKDLFRFDLGDPAAGYQEVLQRVLQATDPNLPSPAARERGRG